MLRPVLLMILFMSCTSIVDTPEHADVTKYYYDISSSDGTEYSDRIVQMVSDKIGMKKCAITNYSGTEWPFYQEYSIDEKVKKSELMPPHTHIHVYHPLPHVIEPDYIEGDHMLKVDIQFENDQISFDMTILKWTGNIWNTIVNTNDHRIERNYYNSEKELVNRLYKSILRYSFK